MKLIRESVFETNSSSTHSLTVCLASTLQDWKDGKLLYSEGEDKFYEVGSQELRDFYASLVLESRYDYDYSEHIYSDGENKYTKEELFTQERLNSITDEEIKEYIDKNFDIYEFPVTYKEWEEYYGEQYELYEQHNTFDSIEVVGFGYYGYN